MFSITLSSFGCLGEPETHEGALGRLLFSVLHNLNTFSNLEAVAPISSSTDFPPLFGCNLAGNDGPSSHARAHTDGVFQEGAVGMTLIVLGL